MDDIALDFLSQGYSIEALAGELDIHKDTIYQWINPDSPTFKESFSDAIKRGYNRGRRFWESLGIEMSKGELTKGNFVTWIFNMKNRYGWADKTEVKNEHTFTNLQDLVAAAYAEQAKQSRRNADEVAD